MADPAVVTLVPVGAGTAPPAPQIDPMLKAVLPNLPQSFDRLKQLRSPQLLRPDLGSSLGDFSPVPILLEQALSYEQPLMNTDLTSVPARAIYSLDKQLGDFAAAVTQILNWPLQAQGPLAPQRSHCESLINSIREKHLALHLAVGQVMGVNSKPAEAYQRDCLRLVHEIEEQAKHLHDTGAEADRVMAKVRAAAGTSGIAGQAHFFSGLARSHAIAAWVWLVLVTLSAGATISFGYWIATTTKGDDPVTGPSSASQPARPASTPPPSVAQPGQPAVAPPVDAAKVDSTPDKAAQSDRAAVVELIKFFAGRLLIMSMLLYLVAFTAKNYRANRHNEVANRHRATALSTFDNFANAADPADPALRNAILLEATRCIFGAQPTGYSEAGPDGPQHPALIEILSKVGGKKEE